MSNFAFEPSMSQSIDALQIELVRAIKIDFSYWLGDATKEIYYVGFLSYIYIEYGQLLKISEERQHVY